MVTGQGGDPLGSEIKPEARADEKHAASSVTTSTSASGTTSTRRMPLHRRFFPMPRPDEATERQPGLYPGEPANAQRNLRQFLLVWVHLALIVAVLKQYHVEGRALFYLSSLALAALPIHYALPTRWKKAFFLGTSVVGLVLVFGPLPSLVVSALALMLIGVCRLPLAWNLRAGLVAVLAVGLGCLRAAELGLSSELQSIVWPVLGSMLMFRLALYLYEIKHAREPEPWVDTLGYFFLLPNYAFMLFPVVDYRTLKRSHLSQPIHQTQTAGLGMMVNGVVQLLLYRVVEDWLKTGYRFEDVESPSTLAGFLVLNYLLYLKVSGQFHIACGMLHLFGYQLPTTHHHYFLATSFTDYWRRINIYWKDFMVRVVFNPVAFQLKRKPRWLTLSVATAAVFLVTWFLHGYQMFWLKGRWGFNVPDTLFWGILGALVLVNVQMDARAGDRPRPSPEQNARWLPRLKKSAQTLATFATITLLWSLWSSPSLGAWFAMFRRAFGV